jgi:septal ring factor EnvC (AmiA/AmiB activator)
LILASDGAEAMVDVDSALLSVQERDNWRRRMDVLERSLTDVRDRRRRLETRLRRVRRELGRLREAAEAILPTLTASPSVEMVRAAPSAPFHNR